MIGIEARDLRQGDDILGMGVVKKVRRDGDGDIAVEFGEGQRIAPGYYASFDPEAWLRIERKG